MFKYLSTTETNQNYNYEESKSNLKSGNSYLVTLNLES
jgi:hypothetical protein